MGEKTAGVGHFQIPTAPAPGVAVAQSGTANTYTATYVQITASSNAAAIFITGLYLQCPGAANLPTYISVQLATGAAGSEAIVGQYLVNVGPTSGVAATEWGTYRPIAPWIPIPATTRIAAKTASSVAVAIAHLVSLECILQTNVVDDGIVDAVNVQQIAGQTASAAAGVTFPSSIASPTNITAGTITTVTTVTNQLTAAAIATGVWQDAVAGDFTTANSIGKALYIANIAPGAAGGHFISGSNAGTTTLGALTVTGATTHTGNVVLSDGLTISAPGTLNRAGLDIAGNGTGAAMKLVGGATGIGFSIAGGGTSGDGVKVTTTSGHGINLAPVGTSMHGLLSTGGNGGTSDGIKAVAGTGGVDIRGNITGNLVGTVSTLTTYTGNTPQTGDSFARIGAAGAGLTALGDTRIANLDATVSSRMATYTQPTGFLAATFPTGTIANTTNITAGVITTATNLTTNNDKTGYTLSSAGVQAIWDALTSALTTVGSIGKKLADWVIGTAQTGDSFARIGAAGAGLTALGDTRIANLDATITSRMATFVYTAPDNTSVAAIKLQTDKLAFTVANQADVNIRSVNNVTVNGVGTSGSPWG